MAVSLDSPLKLLKRNWERRATVHADGSTATGNGSAGRNGGKDTDKDAGDKENKEKETRRKGSTRRWSLVPRMRGPSPGALRKHFKHRGREEVEEVKAAEVTAVE